MNSRRSGCKLTLPPPHGQSPAMARTNVLLPVPVHRPGENLLVLEINEFPETPPEALPSA